MNLPIDFRQIAEEIVESHPKENLFFLLDHGGLPGLSQQLRHCAATWTSLFEHSREESALSVAPVLVLAASAGRISLSRLFFTWLREHGTNSSAVMLLVSPLGLDSLTKQLAMRLDITLPENIDAMLRFFDPRVFEALLKVMTDEQARDFLGVATSWYFVDRAGKVNHATTKFDETQSYRRSLVLNQVQETSLVQACEVDQVFNLLRSSSENFLSRIQCSNQFYFIQGLVDRARSQNLKSLLQLSLYAMIGMLEELEGMDADIREELVRKIRGGDIDGLQNILLNKYPKNKGGRCG